MWLAIIILAILILSGVAVMLHLIALNSRCYQSLRKGGTKMFVTVYCLGFRVVEGWVDKNEFYRWVNKIPGAFQLNIDVLGSNNIIDYNSIISVKEVIDLKEIVKKEGFKLWHLK